MLTKCRASGGIGIRCGLKIRCPKGLRVRVPPRPPKESVKSKVKITGIKAIGHHGVNDGEQDRPQTFYVDVELVVEVADDEIGQTQDYREVTELVRQIVELKRFNLIETMAQAVAKKIYNIGKSSGVRVIIHKPAAAKSLLVEDVTAEFVINGGVR